MNRSLHVVLLGSRGAGNYGGYETLMSELGARLVERGFRVTIYARSHSTAAGERSHRGAELRVLPTVRTKYFDTPVHTLLSTLDARGRGFDAALVVNSANALFVPLLRAAGIPTALHVDGIEKRRAKWGPLGRAVYALSERLACSVADVLVTDAQVIRQHYLRRYGAESEVITYGVDAKPPATQDTLDRLGLSARGYFLYVSRFEPENNPHNVVAAYATVRGSIPLVMVGGAPYAGRFIRSFTEGADSRIRFPGTIFGDGYRELLANALAYIHATDVGGTHPALVEAMGYGNALVVNDTPENREVAGRAAVYFRAAAPATLASALERLMAAPEMVAALRLGASTRAQELFSWEAVAQRYQNLFERLAGSGSPRD